MLRGWGRLDEGSDPWTCRLEILITSWRPPTPQCTGEDGHIIGVGERGQLDPLFTPELLLSVGAVQSGRGWRGIGSTDVWTVLFDFSQQELLEISAAGNDLLPRENPVVQKEGGDFRRRYLRR